MLSRRVIHFYKKNFEIVIAVVYWSYYGARDDTGQIKIHKPKYSGVIVNKTEIKKSIRDVLGDWVTQVRRSQPADQVRLAAQQSHRMARQTRFAGTRDASPYGIIGR